MKRLLIYLAVMTIAVAASAWAELATPGTSHDEIVGTWKLESADHNGQPNAPGTTQIKMYSKSRYMWVQYDPAKNKTLASGTGSYRTDGKSLTEHVELLDVNAQDAATYVGKDLTFNIKVEGDILTQTGTIGQMNLKETWKRMD